MVHRHFGFSLVLICLLVSSLALVGLCPGLLRLGAVEHGVFHQKDASTRTSSEDEVGDRIYIWQDDGKPGKFLPTGWMPDGQGITQSTAETDSPHTKPHCLRLGCQLSAKPWVGIYFLLEGEWEPRGSFNLIEKLGAKQGEPIVCRFWARSKEKNEKERAQVQFKVGGVTKGQVKDSLKFPVSSPWVKLGPEWKMYEIDLTGKDLSSLVGAFVWVCDRAHNGEKDIGFDLDDIYFVRLKAQPKSD